MRIHVCAQRSCCCLVVLLYVTGTIHAGTMHPLCIISRDFNDSVGDNRGTCTDGLVLLLLLCCGRLERQLQQYDTFATDDVTRNLK